MLSFDLKNQQLFLAAENNQDIAIVNMRAG